MEIALTDDQEFFRDTTRKFLGQRVPDPEGARAACRTPTGFERDYWRQGAELGWTSLLVPEDLGGGSVSGNGPADLALVADAFGAPRRSRPLAPVQRRGRRRWPARGATSSRASCSRPSSPATSVATWAFTEAAAARRARRRRPCRAEADGDGYVLTGVKSPVEAGAEADQLLVTAHDRRRCRPVPRARETPTV